MAATTSIFVSSSAFGVPTVAICGNAHSSEHVVGVKRVAELTNCINCYTELPRLAGLTSVVGDTVDVGIEQCGCLGGRSNVLVGNRCSDCLVSFRWKVL